MSDLNQNWNIPRKFSTYPHCQFSGTSVPRESNVFPCGQTDMTRQNNHLLNCFSKAPINHKLSIRGCVSCFSLRIMKTALASDGILSTSTVHGRYNLGTSLYLPFIFPLAASLKTHDTSKIHCWGQGTTHLLVPVEQDAGHVCTKHKSCSRTAFLWSCLILYLPLSLKKNLR